MNALSEDLRERVMSYTDNGHTYREASAHFLISERSVCRWSQLRRKRGNLKAILVPRSPHKLPDKELLEYVEAHPDAFLREIAEHFHCCTAGVYKALKRLKVTYKKTEFIPGTERRKTQKICRFRKSNASESSCLHR
jgi:transposase